MDSALIGALVPVLRQVADSLAGTPAGDDAETDLRSLEAVIARHVGAAEAEVMSWLAGRLHPQTVQPPA